MDKNKIIEKLKNFLRTHKIFREEGEVVYLMVEIRKILDIDKSNPCQRLRFYCNWTLHVNLKNKNTTQFISNMFDQYIDVTKSGKEIAREMISEHPDFFKLNDLKTELRNFFVNHALPINLINKNKYWFTFIRLLLEVVEKCPVVCIKSSNKIDELILLKDDKGNFCYRFSLVNDKQTPKIKLKFK